MANFEKFGLLYNLNFVAGYFADTLPKFNYPIAVLRLDCDSARNTRQAMECLWPKLSPGGYLIHDDAGEIVGLQGVIEDYLGWKPDYQKPDKMSVWFQKPH